MGYIHTPFGGRVEGRGGKQTHVPLPAGKAVRAMLIDYRGMCLEE